jgi:hypothetical protein
LSTAVGWGQQVENFFARNLSMSQIVANFAHHKGQNLIKIALSIGQSNIFYHTS